jgi:hypothetical protein
MHYLVNALARLKMRVRIEAGDVGHIEKWLSIFGGLAGRKPRLRYIRL